MQIGTPLEGLYGRGGFIRLRAAQWDLTLIAVYPPPAGTPISTKARKFIGDWAQKCFHDAPTRSFTFIGGDFNDRMGLSSSGGDWVSGTGAFNTGKSHSEVWESFCSASDVVSVNTFFSRAGPTYYNSAREPTGTIDHVLALRNDLWRFRSAVASSKLHSRLQLHNTRTKRDHTPVIYDINIRLRFVLQNSHMKKWDTHLIPQCLQNGRLRHAFLEKLNTRMLNARTEFDSYFLPHSPDQMWQLWIDIVQDVAFSHYGKS